MSRQYRKHNILRAACGAAAFFIAAGLPATAIAQGSTAPTSADICNQTAAAVTTGDAPVAISPHRGWQMENRDMEIAFTSALPAGDLKPLVCFRWKLRGGGGTFVPAASVRAVSSTGTQQPPLKLTVTVPDLGARPPRDKGQPEEIGIYTPDNAAPVADVRVFLFDANDKLVARAATAMAVVRTGDYCNVPTLGTRTESGTIVPSESKNWQPMGGEIAFTVNAAKTIPSDALIKPCFRWKLRIGDPGPFKDSGPTRVLDRQPTTVKLGVAVPYLGSAPSPWSAEKAGSYEIPYLLVPQADVRVLLFDADLNPIIDAWTIVGVTSVLLAAAIVVFVVAGTFAVIWRVARRRFHTFDRRDPLLCLITTRQGYASLSQFQIVLWTFVVIASAAYVFSLAGDLIPITTGTLVLLGISGGTTVISKAKSEKDDTASRPVDPATAAADAELAEQDAQKARDEAALTTGDDKEEAAALVTELTAKATAMQARAEAAAAGAAAARARGAVANASDKAKAEADAQQAEADALTKRTEAAVAAAKAAAAVRIRHPRWSDLIMEEIAGRELDVTRVQMLMFTLVTAIFVLSKVLTSYEIPDIPEGFLILMGISNGVYVGSKFVTNPAPRP